MAIEKINIERLDEVFTIYKDCKAALDEQGIYQSTDKYPVLSTVEADIQAQELFGVIENGKCLGLICLNEEQSPQYDTIGWQCLQRKVLVIHRLAVAPGFQKQGIARQLMDFAEYFAKEQGYAAIRLDSYSANERSVALYVRRGYTNCGQVFFEGRELPFFCFEKAVN